MPTTQLHTLTWSADHHRYALATQGQLVQMFAPEDTDVWQIWQATATAFTFRGAAGRLNVYLEARGETAHYWYAGFAHSWNRDIASPGYIPRKRASDEAVACRRGQRWTWATDSGKAKWEVPWTLVCWKRRGLIAPHLLFAPAVIEHVAFLRHLEETRYSKAQLY